MKARFCVAIAVDVWACGWAWWRLSSRNRHSACFCICWAFCDVDKHDRM